MLKRYIFVCLPLIFLLNSHAHSHWTDDDFDNFDILFFHPVSLVYGITKSETLIHLTTKWWFIIIDPSYLNKKDYTRFGSGFGYRYRDFLSPFYVQLKPSLHYLKYEDTSSGPMIEVLGYVGVSKTFMGFLDAGIGYKWNQARKNHGLAIEVNAGLSALLLPYLFLE